MHFFRHPKWWLSAVLVALVVCGGVAWIIHDRATKKQLEMELLCEAVDVSDSSVAADVKKTTLDGLTIKWRSRRGDIDTNPLAFAYIKVSECYVQEQEYAKALRMYEVSKTLKRRFPYEEVLFGMYLEAVNGSPVDAHVEFEQRPGNNDALAVASLYSAGKYRECLEATTQAVPPPAYTTIMLLKGRALLKLGEYDTAIEVLTRSKSWWSEWEWCELATLVIASAKLAGQDELATEIATTVEQRLEGRDGQSYSVLKAEARSVLESRYKVPSSLLRK